MNLKIYKSNETYEWNEIIKSCIGYDFYHTCFYHKIEEISQAGEAILLFFNDSGYHIAFPLLFRNTNKIDGLEEFDWMDVTSVYGYAGPLVSHSEMPKWFINKFQESLINYFHEKKVICAFSRLHPLMGQTKLLEDYGETLSLSKTISIDLSKRDEDQWLLYRKSLKYDIRKLKKEQFICIDDIKKEHLDDFIQIYHENMKRVSAPDYYSFTKEYFYDFFQSPDFETKLFVCLKGTELVVGSIFVICNKIVQYHLSGTLMKYSHLSPSKLIIDTVRIWATNLGYKIFHLGGGVGSQEDGLFKFKSGFSNVRHEFSIWKIILNEDAYKILVSKKEMCNIKKNMDFKIKQYFPLYRSPLINL